MTVFTLRNFDTDPRHDLDLGAGDRNSLIDSAKADALIAEARGQGFTEGHAQGLIKGRTEAETEQADAVRTALATIGQQLEQILNAENERRETMARDIADLLTEIAERVVPEMLEQISVDLVEYRLDQGLRMASRDPGLRIRLSPQAHEVVADRIAEMADALAPGWRPQVISDPAMHAGDLRLNWDSGYLDYSLDRVCNDLLDVLRTTAGELRDKTGTT